MVRNVGLAVVALLLVGAAVLDGAAMQGTGSFVALLASFAVAVGATVAALRCRTRRSFVVSGSVLGAISVLLSVAALAWSGHPATWGLAESVALALLTATVVRSLATRAALPVALLLTAALVLGPSRVGGSDAATFALLSALLATVAVAVGLLRRADDLRTTDQLTASRHRERRAIARDLHDDLAHHITGLVVAAQAARFGSQDVATLHAALESVEEAGRQALRSMRGAVSVLRDADSSPLPLTIAGWPEELHAVAAEHAVRTGIPVLVDADACDLTAGHRQAVLRITREALTNVRRHARDPQEVCLRLWRDGSSLHLVVADDGRREAQRHDTQQQVDQHGVDQHPVEAGFGLVGLRERAEILGGALRAGPDPISGWRVQATLPLLEPPHRGPR